MDDGQLTETFRRTFPFFDAAMAKILAQQAVVEEIGKGGVFIDYRRTDRRIGLVLKGIFRGVGFQNDEEQTLWFSSESDIMASYSSIWLGQPSNLRYEALEDSAVAVIGYQAIRDVIKDHPEWAEGLIELLEHLLLESYQRLEKFLFYSPEDRYRKILADKPEILNRVSQKHLASYIGITPVSLSRLRARLRQG